MRRIGATITLIAAAATSGCAPQLQQLHDGPTNLGQKERSALRRARGASPDRFQYFWHRPDTAVGPVNLNAGWSAIPAAPAALRVEVQRELTKAMGAGAGEGAAVQLTVIVFAWEAGSRVVPPLMGVEIVARDARGTVLWMGEDRFHLSRAVGEGDDVARLAGQELVARMRNELGLPTEGGQPAPSVR
jgi:hypothetical protein